MTMKKQNSVTRTFGVATKITLDAQCNTLAVKNAGNSICLINQDPLVPGEVKIFGAWQNEILTGKYEFSFQTPPGVPITYVQNDEAVVTQLYYLPS